MSLRRLTATFGDHDIERKEGSEVTIGALKAIKVNIKNTVKTWFAILKSKKKLYVRLNFDVRLIFVLINNQRG